MRISVEGFPDRYDVATKHDHLVCKKCGKLSDVYLDDLTDSLQEQVEVEVESYDLKISYICPACRKKIRESESFC